MRIIKKILKWIAFIFLVLWTLVCIIGGFPITGLANVVLCFLFCPVKSVEAFFSNIFNGKVALENTVIIALIVAAFMGTLHTPDNNTVSADSKPSPSASPMSEITPIPTATPEPTPTPVPTCDGTTVTTVCQLDGVMYNKYIFHPAVPEQSHVEHRSEQVQVQTGSCTLCGDGSTSYSVGRGTCSHHGGVAQYNHPIYGTRTNTWDETVIDAPAQEEYYETEPAQ